jgi:hypothetical protein
VAIIVIFSIAEWVGLHLYHLFRWRKKIREENIIDPAWSRQSRSTISTLSLDYFPGPEFRCSSADTEDVVRCLIAADSGKVGFPPEVR